MADEKDLKKVSTDDKKAVAGGVVYEFIRDGRKYYFVASGDGNEVKTFSDKDEAVKYSSKQGYDDNSVITCKDEHEAIMNASADCVENLFMNNL